jgi:hypothetical protein
MERKRPPDKIDLRDIHGEQVRLFFHDGGLVLRTGNWCKHIQPDQSLLLVRWLLWHALHGRWAPRADR